MQLTQREEQFFKAMAGDGSAPVPVSREERFMADIVSGESSGLNPLTAEERALNGLVGKIGGGGDSDFSTAEVTITNTGNLISASVPYVNSGDIGGVISDPALEVLTGIPPVENFPIPIPLYKGRALGIIHVSPSNITATGDITVLEIADATGIIITGNGSITISS